MYGGGLFKLTRRNWNRNGIETLWNWNRDLSIPASGVQIQTETLRLKIIGFESELESKFHGIGIGIELNK